MEELLVHEPRRNGHVLLLAARVGEAQVREFRLFFFYEFQYVTGCHIASGKGWNSPPRSKRLVCEAGGVVWYCRVRARSPPRQIKQLDSAWRGVCTILVRAQAPRRERRARTAARCAPYTRALFGVGKSLHENRPRAAHVPGADLHPAALLVGAGMPHPAALRHGSWRRHGAHRDLPARRGT